MRLACFLLAWPALAIPITGGAFFSGGGGDGWSIASPEIAMYMVTPSGPGFYGECPCPVYMIGTPNEISGLWSWGFYAGEELHGASADLIFTSSVLPTELADGFLVHAAPVTVSGTVKGWGPAPPLPDDVGEMLFYARVKAEGTMRTFGEVSLGSYYITHLEMDFAGDVEVLYPPAVPIPEPGGVALLAASLAGVALLALTGRQSAGVARVRASQRPAGARRRGDYAVG
jgi:hypothetical protein